VGIFSHAFIFPKTKNILSLKGVGTIEKRGAKYSQMIDVAGSEVNANVEEKYITSSGYGSIQANFGNRVKFFMNAGLMVFAGYKSWTSVSVPGTAFTQDSACFCTVDIGFVFGTGVSANLGKRIVVFVEPRYTLGLLNIERGEHRKSRAAQLLFGVGYVFYKEQRLLIRKQSKTDK
jgi:hypothetical protein